MSSSARRGALSEEDIKINERVVHIRQMLGMARIDVCDQTGMSPHVLEAIERKIRPLRAGEITKLAQCFKLSPANFYDDNIEGAAIVSDIQLIRRRVAREIKAAMVKMDAIAQEMDNVIMPEDENGKKQ